MTVLKKFVASCAAIFGLILIPSCAQFNARGKAAWDNFKKEWEAKGEVFDYKQVIPKPVPTEKNFAHKINITKLLKRLLQKCTSVLETRLATMMSLLLTRLRWRSPGEHIPNILKMSPT